MIKRIWSDLATFRPVSFAHGMNIVLADTNADSEETESTNGLGKHTLLRIIHFFLGSDFRRDNNLSPPELSGVNYYLDYPIEEPNYPASRTHPPPPLGSARRDF